MEDASGVTKVRKERTLMMAHFFGRGQFRGRSGSSGEKSIMLGSDDVVVIACSSRMSRLTSFSLCVLLPLSPFSRSWFVSSTCFPTDAADRDDGLVLGPSPSVLEDVSVPSRIDAVGLRVDLFVAEVVVVAAAAARLLLAE